MIFITGPMFSGKEAYIRNALKLSKEEFDRRAVRDAQALIEGSRAPQALQEGAEDSRLLPEVRGSEQGDLAALADSLARYEIVIAAEIGGGVVPIDREERLYRERAGRLACLLAERADTVIRVCCGLPQLLKGQWPS